MLLATRGTCLLDQPEAPIEDPEAVQALKDRARTIQLQTALITTALTTVLYFVP